MDLINCIFIELMYLMPGLEQFLMLQVHQHYQLLSFFIWDLFYFVLVWNVIVRAFMRNISGPLYLSYFLYCFFVIEWSLIYDIINSSMGKMALKKKRHSAYPIPLFMYWPKPSHITSKIKPQLNPHQTPPHHNINIKINWISL